ncbi:MAG: C69 family dipeptidase, partial [Erysipelotrichaceae bacterium]|nr:C69 family dipeptidase [Erysipelotrichaceae bacterium]
MPCTTFLVGKNASYDGSTLIARNDDGFFDVKKLVVIDPKKQGKKYKGVISHLEIELPDNPLRYTATPSVDDKRGIWAANGINEANVAMTATETLTTNPRVLGGDPYVVYQKPEGKNK